MAASQHPSLAHPTTSQCSNTPESTTGGFGAYIQKQLALGAAEDLKRQAPGATQGGEASFGFRPTGCCATPYCAPTFAPLSLTNPACLVGQHVSLLTGEKVRARPKAAGGRFRSLSGKVRALGARVLLAPSLATICTEIAPSLAVSH